VLVEIEVHKSETAEKPAENTNIDINEIIGKVRSFVDSIREMSANGEPMTVSVDTFNVSVGKDKEEYEFAMKLGLVIKPKASPS
jgi:hypothetical protein